MPCTVVSIYQFIQVPLGLNALFLGQAVGFKAILDPAQCCNFLKYRALAVAIVACDESEL